MRFPWWLAVGAFAIVACNTATLDVAPPGVAGDSPTCTDGEANCSSTATDAGTKKKDASVASTATSDAVSILVEPAKGVYAMPIQDAIKNAQTSVHVLMYLLTDTYMINALGDAVARGVDVKVVLNKTFPSNGNQDDGGTNDTSIGKLKALNVPVKWASSDFNYTHAKMLAIDGQTAIISTMNLAYSSPSTNREYIATDTDADDVADCEKIFAADWADGQDGTHNPLQLASKLVISPTDTNTNGSPTTMLANFIGTATTSLDVEVQSLSDPTLTNAIIAQKKAGLAVRVILAKYDDTLKNTTSVKNMLAAGIDVKALAQPTIHAKSIVVDKTTYWVGSQNFTTNALTANREIGVFSKVAAEVSKIEAAMDTDYAAGAAP